jgi:PKHD-type hydroxylase
MGKDQVRTDVSVTVFLSAPEDYDGGELVIEAPGGESAYKLEAGAAVAYPASTLHRVNEVTRGTREVATLWVQSLVRSTEQRELLFDLERARRTLFEREGKTAEFDLLHKTASNLRRMWVEP